MVVDYQGRNVGGEGYLRIIEFLPDGKRSRQILFTASGQLLQTRAISSALGLIHDRSTTSATFGSM